MQHTEINYLDIDANAEVEKQITYVLEECFKEEKLDNTSLYINVVLTDSKNIRQINNEQRNIDKETDVLSFPMFEKEEIMKIESNIPEVLGDIVISVERVKEQSEEYGHSFEREISYMVVHGFYHILGYDHMEEKDKQEMRKKEENILNKLNITR